MGGWFPAQLVLLLLAASMWLASSELRLPGLTPLAALYLSGCLVLAGAEGLLTRRLEFWDSVLGNPNYRELAAMLWGIVLMIWGAGLAGLVLSWLATMESQTLSEYLLVRRDLVLLGIASFLLAWGGTMVIGPREPGGSLGVFLLGTLSRLIGVAVLALGVGALLLGLVAVQSPEQLEVLLAVIAEEALRAVLQVLESVLG